MRKIFLQFFHQCTKDIYLKIKTIRGIRRWRPDGFSRKDQRGGSHKKDNGHFLKLMTSSLHLDDVKIPQFPEA
jgi:hypothetical protein